MNFTHTIHLSASTINPNAGGIEAERQRESCSDPAQHGRLAAAALIALLAALFPGLQRSASAQDSVPMGVVRSGDDAVKITVPYVTNRLGTENRPDTVDYGGERGPPNFGWCDVSFTPIPLVNEIAARMPFYVANERRQVHVRREKDPQVFWERLTAGVAGPSSGSVVLFLHGYNYGFERHCKSAAELQRKLGSETRVLMFSWPSNGLPTDYIPDQADVEWSVTFLTRILRELSNRLGSDRVQVLAHSLGSRGVVLAFERLRANTGQRPVVGPLVLMAPDFDAQVFIERLPALAPLMGDVILYASENDTPLKVSRQLHEASRLGEAGEFLTVAEGMQTIDVTRVGRYQVLGHEYFQFHPRVMADLTALLSGSRDPSHRVGLRAASRNGLTYWELTEDSPASDARRD